MEEINKLVSPETQALILQCLTVLAFAMPLLERAAEATRNKVDDKILAFVKAALSFVPRVSLGGKK